MVERLEPAQVRWAKTPQPEEGVHAAAQVEARHGLRRATVALTSV